MITCVRYAEKCVSKKNETRNCRCINGTCVFVNENNKATDKDIDLEATRNRNYNDRPDK